MVSPEKKNYKNLKKLQIYEKIDLKHFDIISKSKIFDTKAKQQHFGIMNWNPAAASSSCSLRQLTVKLITVRRPGPGQNRLWSLVTGKSSCGSVGQCRARVRSCPVTDFDGSPTECPVCRPRGPWGE